MLGEFPNGTGPFIEGALIAPEYGFIEYELGGIGVGEYAAPP